MGQLAQSIYLQYAWKPLVLKVGLTKLFVDFGTYHQFGDQDYQLQYKKSDNLQTLKVN